MSSIEFIVFFIVEPNCQVPLKMSSNSTLVDICEEQDFMPHATNKYPFEGKVWGKSGKGNGFKAILNSEDACIRYFFKVNVLILKCLGKVLRQQCYMIHSRERNINLTRTLPVMRLFYRISFFISIYRYNNHYSVWTYHKTEWPRRL